MKARILGDVPPLGRVDALCDLLGEPRRYAVARRAWWRRWLTTLHRCWRR